MDIDSIDIDYSYHHGLHEQPRQEKILRFLRALIQDGPNVNEEDMYILVGLYRQLMLTSNRVYISTFVKEIQQRVHRPERLKLNHMAHAWWHMPRWPRNRLKGAARSLRDCNISHQLRMEERVTRLDQVLNLPHPFMSGLHPRSLNSPGAIETYVQALQDSASEHAQISMNQDCFPGIDLTTIDFTVPNEIKLFLFYTDGLQDPDFRYEGMCGWVLPGLEEADVGELDVFREYALRNLNHAWVDLHELVSMGSIIDHMVDHLDIIAGFCTGYQERHGQLAWRSFYLFCRQHIDDRDWNNHHNLGFAWRIVFDDFQASDTKPHTFNKMAQLLIWYLRGFFNVKRGFLQTDHLWDWGPHDGSADEPLYDSEDSDDEKVSFDSNIGFGNSVRH